MKIYLSIFTIVAVLYAADCKAQSLFNINGSRVFSDNGAVLYVDGDVTCNDGSMLHNGGLTMTGNWINNSAGYVFDTASQGVVYLAGGFQTIQGYKTGFPGLTLSGTDNKQLAVNTQVNRVLDLQDKELDVNGFDMWVTNTDAGAITRTQGYVNTTNDTNGSLMWTVYPAASYVFPLGGGADFRYRPLTVQPSEGGILVTQFRNEDPDKDGYDRRKTEGLLNHVNKTFYHTVDWVTGGGAMQVQVPYSSDKDSIFNAMAEWNGHWELTPTYYNTIQAGEGTDNVMSFSLHDNQRKALALGHFIDDTRIFIVSAFTPNGDGKNDVFFINGLDNYKFNEVRIFNRWGQMILDRDNYKNDWTAPGLDVGTYMYLVRVVDENNNEHIYKGDLTLLR